MTPSQTKKAWGTIVRWVTATNQPGTDVKAPVATVASEPKKSSNPRLKRFKLKKPDDRLLLPAIADRSMHSEDPCSERALMDDMRSICLGLQGRTFGSAWADMTAGWLE